jgi:hypothetical protein
MLAPLLLVSRKYLAFFIPAIPTMFGLAATSASYFYSGYFHYDYAFMTAILLAVSVFVRSKPFSLRLAGLNLGLLILIGCFHWKNPIQLRTPLQSYFKIQTWDTHLRNKVHFLELLDKNIPQQQSLSADYISINYLIRSGRPIFMWSNPFRTSYFGVYGQCVNNPQITTDWVVLRSDHQGEPELIQSLEADYIKYENRALGFLLFHKKGLPLNFELASVIEKNL